MGWQLPSYLVRSSNAAITRFLEQTSPSAHSDVADELLLSADGLAGVSSYCPDFQNSAFLVVHTADNQIFGLAYGMKRLCYQVPSGFSAEVEADGGQVLAEIGFGWVCFNPFDSDQRTEELRKKGKKWCRIAYEHALEMAKRA